MKNKKNGLLRFFFSVLVVFFLLNGTSVGPIGGKEVQAASVKTVNFTDKSGKYLKVYKKTSGNVYYLYDKDNQALTGIQYLRIPKVETGIFSGFYMFDEQGKLIRKNSVYRIVNTKVNKVLFHGYYYTSKDGRFPSLETGLRYLDHLSCGTRTYTGYYYVQKYGKLNATAQCRYLQAVKLNGVSFAKGYYWFNDRGKLLTSPSFQYIKAKINNVNFKGTFYFGGKNGMLELNKGGLKVIKGKTYYLSKWSRRAENSWAKGHYFLEDGVMAVNQKTPDGQYVDGQGNVISEARFEMTDLKADLKKLTRGYQGQWSVYVKNLDSGSTIVLNDRVVYPASTIKAFAMASTFDQIAKGKLKYTSDVKEQLWYMITESDNDAFNTLVQYHDPSGNFLRGASVVNTYISEHGYENTVVHHTMSGASIWASDGEENISCATDAGKLLEEIYCGTCVNEEYSKEMLRLLTNQKRCWKIPAGIPSGITIANKTGEKDDKQHDIAIVYGPKATYILCVFTSGVGEYDGISGIQNVSKTVYEYLNQ